MSPRTHTASKGPSWDPHPGHNHQLSPSCPEMVHSSQRTPRGGIITTVFSVLAGGGGGVGAEAFRERPKTRLCSESDCRVIS